MESIQLSKAKVLNFNKKDNQQTKTRSVKIYEKSVSLRNNYLRIECPLLTNKLQSINNSHNFKKKEFIDRVWYRLN